MACGVRLVAGLLGATLALAGCAGDDELRTEDLAVTDLDEIVALFDDVGIDCRRWDFETEGDPDRALCVQDEDPSALDPSDRWRGVVVSIPEDEPVRDPRQQLERFLDEFGESGGDICEHYGPAWAFGPNWYLNGTTDAVSDAADRLGIPAHIRVCP